MSMRSSDSQNKNASINLNWRRNDPVISTIIDNDKLSSSSVDNTRNDDVEDIADQISQNVTFDENSKEFLNYLRENNYELLRDKSTHTVKDLNSEDGKIMPKDCELFIGKLPKDCNEEIVFPILAECGRVHEFRVMMDFDNINRGFAFVTYCNKNDASNAISKMNNYQISEGKFLGVCRSVDNRRLFVGGLMKNKNEHDILSEMKRISTGVVKVISYRSVLDKGKNRGFAFVEYESHKMAAMARRKLIEAKPTLWGRQIAVDWAEPEIDIDDEIMSKVKNLYVRNLMAETTEETLELFFGNVTGVQTIERIKKIKDYAFIHFNTRENAEIAKSTLHGTIIDDSMIDIHWAKPVDKDAYAAYLNKKSQDKNDKPKKGLQNYPTNHNNNNLGHNQMNRVYNHNDNFQHRNRNNFAAGHLLPNGGYQNVQNVSQNYQQNANFQSVNNQNNFQNGFIPQTYIQQASFQPGQIFMPAMAIGTANNQTFGAVNNGAPASSQTLGIENFKIIETPQGQKLFQYMPIPTSDLLPPQTASTKTIVGGDENKERILAEASLTTGNQNGIAQNMVPGIPLSNLQNQIYNFQNQTFYAAQTQAPASIGTLGIQNSNSVVNGSYAFPNNNVTNSQTKIKRGAGGIRAVGTRKYLDKKVNQSSSGVTTATLGLNATLASKAQQAAAYASVASGPHMYVQPVYLAAQTPTKLVDQKEKNQPEEMISTDNSPRDSTNLFISPSNENKEQLATATSPIMLTNSWQGTVAAENINGTTFFDNGQYQSNMIWNGGLLSTQNSNLEIVSNQEIEEHGHQVIGNE